MATVSNLLSIMKKAEKPEIMEEEGEDFVAHILAPSNEVLRMVQHYKNVLELQMLSNFDKDTFEKTVAEFVENRVKHVKLHPLFPRVEGNEALQDLLCQKLEEKIKGELDLLYTQKAPFGSYLAIKHLLPESYETLAGEEIFLSNIRAPALERRHDAVLREYKKAKVDIASHKKNAFYSMYNRAVSSRQYDEIVPKVGYKRPVPVTDPRVACIQQLFNALREPLRKEKQVGDSWDPIKDAPTVPEDNLEKQSLYFSTQ